jgi:hypothetical protein
MLAGDKEGRKQRRVVKPLSDSANACIVDVLTINVLFSRHNGKLYVTRAVKGL